MERPKCPGKSSEDDAANLQSRYNPDRITYDSIASNEGHMNRGSFTAQGGVIYILYTEVFSTDSKTRIFNRAVDRIRGDSRAIDVLGGNGKIRAFGEPTSNRWAKARPIA